MLALGVSEPSGLPYTSIRGFVVGWCPMKVLGPLEHRVRSLASELTPENVVHQGRVWVILLICGIALVCIFGRLVLN
jgi:hypothetical protein